MARSGPTIPIYIDIDTSAKQAIQKWDKYNKEFQKISAKYESRAKAAGMNAADYKPMFKQLASYKVAMRGTAKSADELRARIQALTATLNATNPDTKKWQKYSEQLKQAKMQLAEIEKRIHGYGAAAGAGAAKVGSAFGALNSTFSLQNSYLGRLLVRMSAYASVYQLASMLRKVRDITAEFELQRVALGAILRDTQAASELFNRIKAAAVKSPFEIKDLVSYTKQLAAYQIQEEKLFDTTMKLADISAGLGVDMQRLILAFGQVKAASVLRGQELRQFTEAGIPMVQALADKFTELRGQTVSTAEVFDLISKKAVSFKMVEEVLNEMTEAGGMFYRMQEKQAETLAGQFSNLKDSISIMYDEIGRTKEVRATMELFISSVKYLAENWRTVIAVAKGAVYAFAAVKIAQANAAIAAKAYTGALTAEVLAEYRSAAAKSQLVKVSSRVYRTILTGLGVQNADIMVKKLEEKQTLRLAAAYKAAAGSTNIFTTALSKLYIALLSNPFTAIVAAALVFISVMTRSRKEVQTMSQSIDELQNTTQKYADALKHEKEMDGMIDKYDELSKKQDLTAKESRQLKSVTEELAQTFPEAVSGINAETGAVSLLTDKMRELNKETKEGLAKALEAQIAADKQRLKERQELNAQWSKEIGTGKSSMYTKIEGEPLFSDQWFKKVFWSPYRKVKDTGEFGRLLAESIADAANLDEAIKAAEETLKGLRGETEEETKELEGWRKSLADYKKDLDGITYRAFSDEEIEKFESEKGMIEEALKRYHEYAAQRAALDLAIVKAKDEAIKASLENDRAYAEALEKLYAQLITDFNGWSLDNKNKKGSGKTAADMFTELTKSQADFFKDFKKNVSDLNKYLSESDAVSKVSELMGGRAKELGIDMLGLNGSAETYSAKLKSLIDGVQKKIQKFSEAKGKNTLVDLMGLKTTNTELQKYLDLLKNLWSQYTDQMLSDTQAKMKKSFDEYAKYTQQARTAREFYDKMLGMSGNEEFAARVTVSIYGESGKTLEEDIKDEIKNAFDNVDLRNEPEGRSTLRGKLLDYLHKAHSEGKPISANKDRAGETVNADKLYEWVEKLVDEGKWEELRLFIAALPEEAGKVAEQLLDNQRKTDANWLAEIMKTYDKAKSFEDRRTDIVAKAEQDREEIRKKAKGLGLTDTEVESLVTAVDNSEQSQLAALDLEILKSTEEWEQAFGDIDRVGNSTISDLISLIDQLIKKYKEAGANGENALSPEAIKTLEQAKAKLTTSLESRNPATAFSAGVVDYTKGTKLVSQYRNELKGLTEGSEQYKETLDKLKKAENQQRKGLDKMKDGIGQLNNSFNDLSAVVSSTQEIFELLGMSTDSDLAAGFEGVAKAISIVGAALMFVNGVITLLESHPLVLAAMAVATALIAIVTVLQSIKTNRANKEIEKQKKAIERLESAYEELESQMDKTFGADYITTFNQQIENMKSRAEAYRKQAEAERSKGKNADKEAIKDAEQEAAKLEKQIADTEGKLAEHFAGTDLASAARDFAEAWIDAYKEFSNTTDAMSEKFQDMVQSMIIESLAARAMQGLLRPIFDAIDDAAESGGDLTAEEIAEISKMASDSIPSINEAMVNLMNQLAAAGLNVRNQASGLTGISKDIATASEESILGLAAGINTQNFYIAQTNDYVFQILQILRNGAYAAASQATTAATTSAGDNYLASLPTIADHTASIVRHCESMLEQCQTIATDLHRVVQPRGSTGSHWLVTN